jgi:adenylylsulfate kinase-like enzyme
LKKKNTKKYDRRENLIRISEMVNLFLDAGVISLTAFISPLESDRLIAKEIIGHENIIDDLRERGIILK